MTEPLFTFAIIADTHLNPRDGESGSPWRTNAAANARARWAVAALNGDKPDFVLHLGDLVHPIPAQAGFSDAAAQFHAIFGGLKVPLHCLPGNHDIGDKPGDWMPAHTVTSEALATWQETFGPLWQIVDHQDCRFVLHCNPLLGSGLPEDEAQWQWLDETLSASAGKRVFFATHYPLFLTDLEEPEHYDNLANPARERLRRLLLDHKVEAVFAAHVHTIFHTRLAAGGPFQHVVPTLSALRPDYSYLFKAPQLPEHEFGRNDAQKLGYYLCEVFEHGYRLRFRRSDGAELGDPRLEFEPEPHRAYRQPLFERPIGVDLRQGWAQTVAIPYSGVVDEFRRKYVHNDYLLVALQEAGLRNLRVPIDDWLDPLTRERMRDFAALGHRFRLFTIDAPSESVVSTLRQAEGVFASLEVIGRPERLSGLLRSWRAAMPELPLFAARMWTSSDLPAEAVSFSHAIGHGFHPHEHALMAEAALLADGLTLYIGPEVEPARALADLPDLPSALMVYLTLTDPNPARLRSDGTAQAARVMDALGALPKGATLMLDMLEDHDRGYFPRVGLYDTRFNPRALALCLSQTELSD
ncbi:metallophosphoesterase [Rhodobacter sp. NTK016B]|uniref:metallophosphoesterase family protein n=1 Tax=Rhodobacter sp. NTK016B TaxID=2759676 RepID=UPI001A8D8515|nr:metallophosphoesterase [Rhodobacter sp. NTK016B]MBN8291836.1 metallophosphoesterase [Rhodobacter sp. NTK016B]